MDEPVPLDGDDLLFSFFYGTTKEAKITTRNTERKQASNHLLRGSKGIMMKMMHR